MFVDEVDIEVAAGDGGRGAMSFRREKFIPRGGPDGGDGGNGGSVYLVASPHVNTLVNFRFHPELGAERGRHGAGLEALGRNGTRSRARGADRHARVTRRRDDARRRRRLSRTLLARPGAETGQRRSIAQGGTGGARQRALRDLHQPRAAEVAARPAGRSEAPPAAPQAARRRRPRRISERRQVHADLADLGGAAEDRRLPVHHAHAEPRRRAP